MKRFVLASHFVFSIIYNVIYKAESMTLHAPEHYNVIIDVNTYAT